MFSVAMIIGAAVGGTCPPERQHAAEHTGQLCDLDLVITDCSELHVTELHPHILESDLKRRFTNLSQLRSPENADKW